MAVMRSDAMRYVGRPVVCHSQYGIHYGILHHMDEQGVYLRQAQSMQMTSAPSSTIDIDSETGSTANDVEHVWFPLLFIPWLALWALGPWGWWW